MTFNCLTIRKIMPQIFIVIVSIVVAFVIAEGFLRIRFGNPLPRHGEYINLRKAGFRHGTVRVEKDPLTLRIIGIGDSFAYGVVQPTFNYHHVLQKQLSGVLKRPVEVINLGKPSIGPGRELAILEELGLRLSPDIVLWTFFTGNDFTDGEPGVRYTLKDVLALRQFENAQSRRRNAPWFESLRITGYFRFFFSYIRNIGIPGKDREHAVSLPRKAFHTMEKRRLSVLLNEDQLKRTFRTKVRPRLQRAVDMCAKLDIPFLLVVAPDRVEIENDLGRTILGMLLQDGGLRGIDSETRQLALQTGNILPLTIAHDLLAQFDSRPEVQVLDLVETFRSEGRPFYVERDSHWNKEGNRIAAEMISREIMGIIDTYPGLR